MSSQPELPKLATGPSPDPPDPSLPKRLVGPPVTQNFSAWRNSLTAWSDAWRTAERQVRRVLRARGAPPPLIDDAIQNAALRALGRKEDFDTIDGLVRWATVVAWREVQGEWRRQAKSSAGPVPEQSDWSDPATEVEHRITLHAVVTGLKALSASEREAIVSSLWETRTLEPRGTSGAKMRRYRARRRLAALVAAQMTVR